MTRLVVGFQSQDGYSLDDDEPSGGMSARLKNYKLWALAVLIEHGVLLIRILILVCIPTAPAWIEEANDVLAHVLKNLKPARQIEEERKIRLAYKAKTRLAYNELEDGGAAGKFGGEGAACVHIIRTLEIMHD